MCIYILIRIDSYWIAVCLLLIAINNILLLAGCNILLFVAVSNILLFVTVLYSTVLYMSQHTSDFRIEQVSTPRYLVRIFILITTPIALKIYLPIIIYRAPYF